ncbi:hypothetical protein OC846_006341 [Tilletia horrida]|uniref:Major facilitator superfamily (MFS) profile domain-containing protein n=1 Tax=Tilletia horrida TaxID=155126 RepID=A0AAN6JPF3_9BASI|nr:hypothetical protein OC846_006341 [Tilletia horrida]KAK0548795.1 hypothetical protein OC845_003414 [Tilletia horrida]KAK0562818.1 hypothetical protein OC861_005130 [Tilletia horrida]
MPATAPEAPGSVAPVQSNASNATNSTDARPNRIDNEDDTEESDQFNPDLDIDAPASNYLDTKDATHPHGHLAHPDLVAAEQEKREQADKARKERSTSFAHPIYRSADEKDLEKHAGSGFQGGLKPSRTFSRRKTGQDADRQDHPFGGDLSRQETEAHLERFMSQKGNDKIIVHWEGDDDPENPMTWSRTYRWYLTFVAGLLVLNSTFTSSAPSSISRITGAEFGFSDEVAVLTIAIFIVGYCLGPLIWGPASEWVGRKPIFLIALLFYTGWNVGCALSQNTASILIFRFLSGTFAAAPLTNSGGVIGDCWDPATRGVALSIFSVAPFAGPALGPIVGGAINVTGTSWRILYWVCTAFSGFCGLLVLFTVPETLHSVILKRKAIRIRKETGDDRYVAPLELRPFKPAELVTSILFKPFRMLVEEPMLLAMTLYMSFIYGVVYLLFEAYPAVFSEPKPYGHGFNALVSGLMFLGFFMGGVVAVIVYVLFFNPIYVRKMGEYPNGRVPPEERMKVVMLAAPTLVVAFFWFGWTSYPSISFWSPMLAGALLGFGILYVFLGLFNYMLDAYLANAASALAANTVCRSAAGAGFPLFASQMYAKLNPRWASTLLGCLALVMAPIPFVLYKYGPKIRKMSKHAHG